jgi:hypothetical protein
MREKTKIAWWPLLGWGIGVLGHALIVFFGPPARGIKGRMIAKVEQLADQKRMAPSATTMRPLWHPSSNHRSVTFRSLFAKGGFNGQP